MPGRNRRLRLFTFGVVLFFVLLVWTRNSSRRREKYQDYFGDKLAIAGIGGGSVLRPSLSDIPPQQERYPIPHPEEPEPEPEVVTIWVDPPEEGEEGDGNGNNGEENSQFWDDVDGRDLGRQDDWADFDRNDNQQAPLDPEPVRRPVEEADGGFEAPAEKSAKQAADKQETQGVGSGSVGVQDESAAAADISPERPNTAYMEGAGKGRHDPDELDDYDGFDHTGPFTSSSSTTSAPHWTKPATEFYPVKTTISLPSGSPKPFPKIQREEKKLAQNGADVEKRAAIKAATDHAWRGYVLKAFGADEIKPVSGLQSNPFNGWGATLVDSLDTLWIMGMKDEFEEAVEAVAHIDFTTSKRSDIPVFETTIRYLGGLIGAFDVTGRDPKYRILLDKAIELGEILYSAFDTPNRMPQTFYRWNPDSAKLPHKAGGRTVMSELGSLSMEFTRLAQLTQEPKYYDAIARITDEFESFQNFTRLPGMWPTSVDASGCDSGGTFSPNPRHALDVPGGNGEQMEAANPIQNTRTPSDAADAAGGADISPTRAKKENLDDLMAKGEPGLKKIAALSSPNQAAAINDLGSAKVRRAPPDNPNAAAAAAGSTCLPKGLSSSSNTATEIYTLSGMSDSTYEYLPKEYLLLGGLAEQYKSMYLFSADTVIQNLLFRPMTPDSRDILVSGELKSHWNSSITKDNPAFPAYYTSFRPEIAHLTCFAGGMFAMAGVIFNKPEHVQIGSKLTDGCVWAYNSTASGIMPEGGELMMCPETWGDCPWNETAYWDFLDPYSNLRHDKQNQAAEDLVAAALGKIGEDIVAGKESSSKKNAAVAKASSDFDLPPSADDLLDDKLLSAVADAKGSEPLIASTPDDTTSKAGLRRGYSGEAESIEKDDTDNDLEPNYQASDDELAEAAAIAADGTQNLHKRDLSPEAQALRAERAATHRSYSAEAAADITNKNARSPPPSGKKSVDEETQAEFIARKLRSENLPAGFTKISGRRYLLRPEAIESVFYMYRISGDPYWREVGWQMWESVHAATRVQFGASAIDDVGSAEPNPIDSQESFWLAETVKYFYLLFDDPESWSLDDWVLNTEAHFFKRPSYKAAH